MKLFGFRIFRRLKREHKEPVAPLRVELTSWSTLTLVDGEDYKLYSITLNKTRFSAAVEIELVQGMVDAWNERC